MMATNVSFLPLEGTPEWEQLVQEFPTATNDWLDTKARELGYKNRDTFLDAMSRRRGIKRLASMPSSDIPSLSDVEARVLKIVQTSAVSVGEINIALSYNL